MKNLIHYVILAITLLASTIVFSATPLKAENRHAVEVSFNSNGNEFDVAAYRKLRKVIGNSVTNGVIDKLLIYGYGSEGGFSGCIEENPATTVPNKALGKIVKQLNNINPELGISYSVQRIKNCLALPSSANKPATVKVAKPNASVSCTFSSGISLTDMRKKLGNIVIYSANKVLINAVPNACGFQSGELNVYEIAETDLDATIALGFSLQPEITTLQSNPTPLARADCITLITNGGQYLSCTSLKEDCNWLLPLTRYANNTPESVRKNVRKACGEQPINPGDPVPAASTIPQWKKDWKKLDCNNLRDVYKNTPVVPALKNSQGVIVEPAVTYSLDYRRYVWRTCNSVTPPSWGLSP